MFCSACGNEISEGAKFCGSCGAPVTAKSEESASSAVQQSTNEHNAPQASATPQPPVSSEQEHAYQQKGTNNAQATYQQDGAYQQQAMYQQPQTTQKVYANTTGNSRALAMSAYWGLLPLIFCAVVGDKDTDPFIRHHLNQALVIFIGSIIAAVTSFIIVGGILAIYLLVMVIMGTVHASHGEMTELPLIGKIKIYK